jgi:hypothetical protein
LRNAFHTVQQHISHRGVDAVRNALIPLGFSLACDLHPKVHELPIPFARIFVLKAADRQLD